MSAPTTPVTGAEVLRQLGLEALIELLETTAYGVCVTGDDHTWVYLNPAAERIFGAPLAELRGKDYLLHFPEHEREVLLALEASQRSGDTEFYTNTVIRADGTEREMTWSGTVMHVDGSELAPAILHETTPVRRALRSAAELGAAAVDGAVAEGAVEGAVEGRSHVLDSLVREAVAATRAAAAVLLLEDTGGLLHVAASSGTAADLLPVVRASAAMVSDLPGTDDLARGRSLFLSDAADRFTASPRTSAWPDLLARVPWTGAAVFGVRCEGQLAGALVVLLPSELASPSESELTFWSSLADQASIAVGADRVREHVWQSSLLTERSRIARDLHDSVSQALFSLHARAQVIRRALDAEDLSLVVEAAQDLETLTRQATGELRELLSELRPGAPERCDLAALMYEMAQRVTRVDGLAVEVSTSPAVLPALPADLGEHLGRITSEALHNVVKHAGVERAFVAVVLEEQTLTMTVRDRGRGFDPERRTGGFGQQTMRERAELCGGRLQVASSAGKGTTVTVTVPLAGRL